MPRPRTEATRRPYRRTAVARACVHRLEAQTTVRSCARRRDARTFRRSLRERRARPALHRQSSDMVSAPRSLLSG